MGSQNLDILSFDFNSEIGVFFQDSEVVQELRNITEDWKRDAIIFDPRNYRTSWLDSIISPVMSLF